MKERVICGLHQKLGLSKNEVARAYSAYRKGVEGWAEYMCIYRVVNGDSRVCAKKRFEDAIEYVDPRGLEESVVTTSSGLAPEEKEILNDFMSRLSYLEKEVVKLRFWEDMTFSQISDELKIGLAKTRGLFYRALLRYRVEHS